MSQRRFSADEVREIAEAIETNEELPSDDWDVLNVCVSGTEESREWTVMVRDNHTLKSYRLKWSMMANGDEDLVMVSKTPRKSFHVLSTAALAKSRSS